MALVSTPLVITGTAGNDTITISPVAGSPVDVTFSVNGTLSGVVRPAGAIQVFGLAGNDQVIVSAGVHLPTIIDGGPGADVLQGGSGNDQFLVRENELDNIQGGLGIDSAATDSHDLVTSIEQLNPLTSTPSNQTQRVKIMVVNFDPRVPSQGNRHLYEIFNWANPRNLVAGYEADLERASGGAIEFEIVEWRDLDEIPAFSDGSRYTPDQYYLNRSTNTNWNTSSSADFPRIVEEQNIVPLIDSGAVDEVWFFGDHFFALPGESWMAGPNSFFINGPTYPQIDSQRAFACMGFSYERGVAEMLHNNGHRTESTLNRVYGGWNLGNPTSNWDRFSANFNQSNGVAEVGTTHWPANAEGDYDTFNTRIVESWADDYLNYPNLTGTTQPVSRATWGKGPNPDYERSYQNWYFAHFPRAEGVNADGKQNNWWKYLYNFENYTSSGQPKNPFARAQVTDIFNLGGTKHQFRVAFSSAVPMSLATLDDNDLVVRGPNGYVASARLVSTSDSSDDVYLVGVYEITAPGGTWDAADQGAYTIELQANQASTVLGATLAAQAVGSFNVRDTAALAIANDADTTLLLRMDGNANGAAGETPTFSSGLTYGTGRVVQAVSTSATGRAVYDQAGNIQGPAGTVEFWIRPDWNADGTSRQFFQAGDNFNYGMLLSIDGARNLRFIQWGDNPSTPTVETGVERGVGVSGASWQAGQWHHLAATWDSTAGTMAFYVDGLLVGSSTTVTIPAFSNSTLSFGARRDGGSPALAGFDEIRISSRARSAGEIQADFAAGIQYVGLTVGQRPGELLSGHTVPFYATATDDFGATYDVSQQVAWTSSDPFVGLIYPNGDFFGFSAGTTTVAARLGSLTADRPVTVQGSQGPLASLQTPIPTVTALGGTSLDFTVRYEDEQGVAVNSLGFGDVRVRDSRGYSFFPTLVSVSSGSNGTPRTATYRLLPPGGSWDPSDNGEYEIEFKDGQIYDVTGIVAAGFDVNSFTVNVPALTPPTFQVMGFAPTATGVVLDFSRDLNAANLNLFNLSDGSLGPADITLVGSTVGPVRGSVVVDPGLRKLTFVSTTGTLPADTYTLTLRSAANGLIDAAGALLDGDSNQTAGGDFVHSFTVAAAPAGAVRISLPNLARGPGQPVNIPANAITGLPLSFSDGGGLSSASFDLRYDPALLNITGASVAPGLVGATVSLQTNTPGIATIQFTSPTPLPAGTTRFVDLQMAVPSAAPYRNKAVLDVANVVLNGGTVAAVADDAVQVVAYFGDTTANGTYSGSDASRIARLAVGIDSGLEEYLLLDPFILADITGFGGISGSDTSRIQQAAAGVASPEIPLPLPTVSLVQGGPDPKLSIPTTLTAAAGDSLIIPVHLDSILDLTGNGVESAELAIYYDATVLDVSAVRLGSLLTAASGWTIASRIDPLAGRVLLSVSSPSPLEGVFEGELVQLQATVKPTAPLGATALNLAASARDPGVRTQLNEGYLTLIPAPTDRADDAGVDGVLTILAAADASSSDQPSATWDNGHLIIAGIAAGDRAIVWRLGPNLVRVRSNEQILGDFPPVRKLLLQNFLPGDRQVIDPELAPQQATTTLPEDFALLQLLAEEEGVAGSRSRRNLDRSAS